MQADNLESTTTKVGNVYILTSSNSEFIKIGGTDHPPLKRIKEINGVDPYRTLGPWVLADFRQVNDWRKVEYWLHYAYRSHLVSEIAGQRELFRLPAHIARDKLNEIDPELILKKPLIDRMFQDAEFAQFIERLFAFTGLTNWLDIQGAWTFVLFPNTAGGRYYTLNIGRHEVAYSTLPRGDMPTHAIVLDRLIYDFPEVINWVMMRQGGANDDMYASGLARSVSLHFKGSFADGMEFFALNGVRRALIAYWSEALIGLKERTSSSIHARHHNWNAVAEINARLQGRRGT